MKLKTLKPMSLDDFSEHAQKEWIEKFFGNEPQQTAELSITHRFAFKDESALPLMGKFYVGVFKKGGASPSGVGRIVYHNGNVYEGMVAKGVKSGFGRLILADGGHIVGYFSEDRLNGLAVQYDFQG